MINKFLESNQHTDVTKQILLKYAGDVNEMGVLACALRNIDREDLRDNRRNYTLDRKNQ
jgi:hypothetical protein